MKILTKELEAKFKSIGVQELIADPQIVAKYFLPGHSFTFYATEYDFDTKMFFGYVTGLQTDEWGRVSKRELEEIRTPGFNLSVECDLYTSKKYISEFCPELKPDIEKRKQEQKEEFRQNELDTIQEKDAPDLER